MGIETGLWRAVAARLRSLPKVAGRPAQRLASLESLLAEVAREVADPLAAIRANLDCLDELAKVLSDPHVREFLPPHLRSTATEAADIVNDARYEADRIRQLVGCLEEFARVTPPGSSRVRARSSSIEQPRISPRIAS